MSWENYGWGHSDEKPRKPPDPARLLAKLLKKNPNICPVVIEGTKIAKTWWGIAWNKNLERYADYDSRIGRGRSYVRAGRVLDLTIAPGLITAQIAGSNNYPYQVNIQIAPLSQQRQSEMTTACGNRVGNLANLLEGRFPQELRDLFFSQDGGLFPSPKEIKLGCSCPDWANMCKHVAAALYGVGTRLDSDPLLFFTLREIDFEALLKKSADEKVKTLLEKAGQKTPRTMSEDELHRVFGDILE